MDTTTVEPHVTMTWEQWKSLTSSEQCEAIKSRLLVLERDGVRRRIYSDQILAERAAAH